MKKNLELTRGLVFSQRVMLALIEKGLSRQEAYKMVQRNAMKAWNGNRSFLNLLKHDTEVMAVISSPDLESIFDYQYYLGHVNEIFNRLGLTEAQWGKKSTRKPGRGRSPGLIQSN
jgi:adenylosuccinate lyase